MTTINNYGTEKFFLLCIICCMLLICFPFPTVAAYIVDKHTIDMKSPTETFLFHSNEDVVFRSADEFDSH